MNREGTERKANLTFFRVVAGLFLVWGGVSVVISLVLAVMWLRSAGRVPHETVAGLLISFWFVRIGVGMLRRRSWILAEAPILLAIEAIWGGYDFVYGWAGLKKPSAWMLGISWAIAGSIWLLFWRYFRRPHIRALFVSQGNETSAASNDDANATPEQAEDDDPAAPASP